MPKKDGTMTKNEAKKEVQKLIAQAKEILATAGAIMDEHQFSAMFGNNSYIPRNMKFINPDTREDVEMTEEAIDDEPYIYVEPKESALSGFYFERSQYAHVAGEWLSSSDWRGC